MAWILLVFSPDSEGTFRIEAAGIEQLTNHSTVWWRARTPSIGGSSQEISDLDEPWSGPVDAELTLGRGRWSSLLLVGEGLSLSFEGNGELQVPFATTQPLASASIRRDHYRPFDLGDASLLLRGAASDVTSQLPASIQAKRLDRIEWTNATVSCPDNVACPQGGVALQSESPVAVVQRMSFIDATLREGQAHGHARVAAAAAGGPRLGFALDGMLRLPEVDLDACTPSPCPDIDDRTLTLQGRVDQAQGSPIENRRIRLEMDATPTVAFSDETAVPGLAQSAGVAAGAIIMTGLAFKLALFLATRPPKDPLANPTRRALYDQILADPGVTFRELMRKVDVANGSLIHHLRVLARAGLVVDQTTGRRRRFFENHGRYDKTWQVVAALRDPEAKALLDWLRSASEVRQGGVLEFAKAAGWPRSTTQFRLNRLVAHGLVHARRQGRHVLYSAKLTT